LLEHARTPDSEDDESEAAPQETETADDALHGPANEAAADAQPIANAPTHAAPPRA
jgi:hypothetical protein